jgi:HK97 family phage major capsid protein
MATLMELARDLETKRGEMKKLLDDHRTSEGYAEAGPWVQEAQGRNDELNKLQASYDEAKALKEMDDANTKAYDDLGRVRRPIPFAGGAEDQPDRRPAAAKSLGERFVESDGFKSWRRGGMQTAAFEAPDALGLKATFTTAASTLTEYDRQPGMVMLGTQRLTIADLLAQGETTMNTIRYVQEDTFTNAATTVAEGLTKPQASFDTSEADAPVRKIAVTAKITDEMFADFPVVRDYVDNRLRFMVAQREEAQILNGDGIAPNITGILATSGILTQAKGADPGPDAVFKAIVKVQTTGFFDPDGVVMNTLDWQNVRLLKTADGIYIWGAPADTAPARIWGLPVVYTTAITLGTALVGAFRLGAQLFRRQGVTVETTNTNVDDFEKNLVSIRAEERLALAVYRPKAFATVTGL